MRPDLVTYGKALANGYAIAAVGGRKDLMDYVVHPDPAKRVLLAGTYNAHPVPTAAAIATIERLLMNDGEVYRHVEALGWELEKGLAEIIERLDVPAVVARQGSAFCLYFMDHLPIDWHDLAAHHDSALDDALRQSLIADGIYFFPLATKQCSISAAHQAGHVDETLVAVEKALAKASAEGRIHRDSAPVER